MGLLYCDSFETTLDQKRWDLTTGTNSVGPSFGRNGNGVQIASSIQKNLDSKATFMVGFAYRLVTSGNNEFLRLLDSATTQVTIVLSSTGIWQAYRGGLSTLLGQSSTATPFNAWHYFETKIKVHPTAGTVEIRVDGVTVLTLSGLNTAPSGNSFSNAVKLGTQGLGTLVFNCDDLVVMDTSGSFNADFVGDVRVQAVFPTANGTRNDFTQTGAAWAASTAYALNTQIIDSNGALQRCTTAGTSGSSHPTWSTTVGGVTSDPSTLKWTLVQKSTLSNFNFVNEPSPDDDSSFVADGTINDQERYDFAVVPGQYVLGAAVTMRIRKDDSGARAVRAVTLSGGTSGDSGADLQCTETFETIQGFFETDPNTGSPWTISALNAAEFGIKIVS